MNSNFRNPEYSYGGNMNFPSLNQANPSTNYPNAIGQNMGLQKNPNMQGQPPSEPPGFSSNQSTPSIN